MAVSGDCTARIPRVTVYVDYCQLLEDLLFYAPSSPIIEFNQLIG